MKLLIFILFFSFPKVRADLLPLNWKDMTEKEIEEYRQRKSEDLEKRADMEFSYPQKTSVQNNSSVHKALHSPVEKSSDLESSLWFLGSGFTILLVLRLFKKKN